MNDETPEGRHNLRVVEIITSHGVVGSEEKNFVTTVRKLRESGDDVTTVIPSNSPNVDFFKAEKLDSPEWKCFGKADMLSVHKLVQIIKSKRADVIHAHSETSALIAGLAGFICKIPVVSTVSAFSSIGSFAKSGKVICASQAIRRHFLDSGYNNEKLTVIFNGLDLKRYPVIAASDARVALKMPGEIKIVGLFAPQLTDEFGVNTTLYAWPDIYSRFLGSKLIIVGYDPHENQHREDIERLGVQTSVEFMGKIIDTRTIMGACDIVIVPSKIDAMSMVAVEAMALGKVVIASRIGGLIEIVEDEQSGLLIEQYDQEGFAQSTAALLSENERAVNMGAIARKRIEQLFNADIQIAKVRIILEEEVILNQEKKLKN